MNVALTVSYSLYRAGTDGPFSVVSEYISIKLPQDLC